MSFHSELDKILKDIDCSGFNSTGAMERIKGQLNFAAAFCDVYPELKDNWQALIIKAAELVRNKLSSTAPNGLPGLASQAEAILAPIGKVAKEYTIHCCGHAHIDMNWTWPLAETIATAHDTYTTLDKLMGSFPELKFGQSQISIYQMMQKYCPEIYEMIKRRIAEGLWQVTAGSWVEGDKNMASGESLCRHMLYSKRWLKDNLGLPYDAVKIDWMPDTFGHPWTMPSILSKGGITRYYRCRPGKGPWLNWWQGPDGGRVLAFCDKGWYNAEITPETLSQHFIDYTKECGLKDFLWVYGVGDHGGGVTKGHILNAEMLDSWPVFPNVKLSRIDSYFDAIEPAADQIPVQDADFNTTFEGCYTSQSRIKKANRLAETIIPEAETISLVADAALGFEYNSRQLQEAWEHMMFNQFHDILAGSSGHAAMEEAEIRFQQVEALTGSIKMRALRKIASSVDTAAALGIDVPENDVDSYVISFGRGAGDIRVPGRISTWSSGHPDIEPLIVFNSLPYSRSEIVTTKVWGRDWPQDRLVVIDDKGSEIPGQVVGSSNDVGHKAVNIIFPAKDIPAMGYRTFGVKVSEEPVKCDSLNIPGPYKMENEHLWVEIDQATGAIKHLIDKKTGFDMVPDGELVGVLELLNEAPHIMTAWEIGAITKKSELRNGSLIDETDLRDSREGDSLGMVFSVRQPQQGPHRIAYRTLHLINESRIRLEIALSSGSRSLEINVSLEWKELGSPETGVPMLRMSLPFNLSKPEFTTEIPFGSQKRPTDGKEFPAQRWVDISDQSRGLTLANDCKYGFSVNDNILRATLIRSTYDPDSYPEIGRHDIRFTLTPHTRSCDPASATRLAEVLNQPVSVIGTGVHGGKLSASASYCEVLTPNISIACIKKAEDSEAIIIRLYETAGKKTQANVRFSDIVKPNAIAVETNILEQPLENSTAKMNGDILLVNLPANGIATVKIAK